MADARTIPDPMARWTPPPDWTRARLSRDRWSARPVLGLSQTLVSGDLSRALEALAAHANSIGAWEIALEAPTAIRIGRDRLLLVSEAPGAAATGWRAEGWASSDVSDALAIFELAGDDLAELVSEATSLDLSAPGPSAAILFAGVGALLYRTRADVARLHVENAHAAYIWRWLETR